MTRKNQLYALIFLSAATAMLQYAIQGSMATGHSPAEEFSRNFWVLDWILWAGRALVEAWVVVYVFMTRPQSTGQRIALTFFEVVLIVLITLTLGPAFHALGAGKTAYEVLGEMHLAWEYAIAAYTSIMMGSAAFAYQFQPFDIEEEVSGPATSRDQADSVEAMAVGAISTPSDNGKMSRNEALPLVQEAIREDRLNQTELAEEAGVSRTAFNQWMDHWVENNVILRLPGRGNYALPEGEEELPF
jgi:hypothetical protein